MSQPTLLLITAATCPACVGFKNNVWPQAKSRLESTGKVRIEEANLPSMDKSHLAKYPSDLQRFVTWFPTLILVSPESWQRRTNLDASVFNGSFVNGIMTHGRDKAPYPTTAQGIMDWVNDQTKTYSRSVNRAQGPIVNIQPLPTISKRDGWSTSSLYNSSTSQTSSQASSYSSSSSQSQPLYRGVVYHPRTWK